jgi:S-adenosylmethionine:tRNA ribosyltransferase-isomerase
VRVEAFDFHLPPERIAHEPAQPRESAKLLHVAHALHDRIVGDLPTLLTAGDILVFNNSKVIPARLFTQGDKRIEVLLHRKRGDGTWQAFAKPAKKLKQGMTVSFGDGFNAEILGRTEDGQVILRFEKDGAALKVLLERDGHMPLPPYIARDDKLEDKTNYQTVYAQHEGSVAAPTAGLHFSNKGERRADRLRDFACGRGNVPTREGRRYGRACHAS